MRGIKFIGHLEGTNPSRVSHKIHYYFKKKRARPQCHKQTENDLTEVGSPDLRDRDAIRKNIQT